MLTTLRQAVHLVGRDHPGRWVVLVVLAIFMSAMEVLGAVMVYTLLALVGDPGGAIDLPILGDVRRMTGDVDEATLLLGIAVGMGVFFLTRGSLKVGVTYVQARVAHNAGARLSNRLVHGYLSWPYAAHLRRNSSELIRNGHQAVQEVVGSVVQPLISLAAETVLVVGMLAVLVTLAPTGTGLAVLVVGGAAVLLMLVIQPKLKLLGRHFHHESQVTLGSLQQSLHGIRDIKVLGAERYFAQYYAHSRLRMARMRYLQATVAQLPKIVIETALLGFILLFFGLTVVQEAQTQETLSILGLFGYTGLRLQPSLQQMVLSLNNLKYSAAPMEDLYADLRAVEALPHDGGQAEPMPFEDALVVEDVAFRYGGTDRDALFGINLLLYPGQQLGICGPTGGGKTTLADIITGLLEPTQGVVKVDGRDVRTDLRAWQRNLGVVPQMVFLTDDTLRRNIALGASDAHIDEEALAEAVELAQLAKFVHDLPAGLDTKVGERGVRISGGQRQRIAIARALYRRPSVLIFDEGTSALDNETEAQLMRSIERLRGQHTIIMIAHRLSTVRSSDVIAFIEQGGITGLGSYDELLEDSPSFRAMASST
jgi:ATP-binding cassette, subfamily B, bacterial PglK